ncbi:MAG: type II secretion system F family protein [Spirochaetaceae bacterium]|jgi:type II secretory pathway component PulF|nr:type II secretion system F family protein [Spirochaetaceae bacterium]
MQHRRVVLSNTGIKSIRLTPALVLEFTESLSALLNAGLSVQDSLAVCAEISAKKHLTCLCDELSQIILSGGRFHAALASFAPSFSPLYINLVKIGETSGAIGRVFDKLTVYLKRKREVKQNIVRALAYPVTICFIAVAIGIFILLFIFPRIQTVIEIFNTDSNLSPGDSHSGAFSRSLLFLFSGMLFFPLSLLSLLFLHSVSPFFTLSIDRLLLRLPILGQALKTFCTSDFAFSMEILCSAGTPFMPALEQSIQVLSNSAFKNALQNSAASIADGISISRAFKMQKIFPDYVTSWIGIGERTGSVEQVFSQIHTYFEHESSRIISNTLAAAQPVFILIAGVIVIFLIWHLVLPVFSILGGL